MSRHVSNEAVFDGLSRRRQIVPAITVRGQSLSPAAFIAAHTTIDQTIGVTDECPICLDNYSAENCLRINGIPGCTHHIGQDCLERLLSARIGQEKKCPMCRATWIAAATPTLAQESSILLPLISHRERDIGSSRAPRLTSVATFLREEAANHEAEQIVGRSTPVLISLDSDSESEDYAAQVEDYNRLSRDIENVRARARNSGVSRTHSRHRPAAAATNNRMSSLFRRPNTPGYPVRSSSLRQTAPSATILYSNDPRTERGNLFTGDMFQAARNTSGSPRLNVDILRITPNAGSPNNIVAEEPEVQEVQEISSRPTRAAILDQRDRDLSARAAALDARELRLREREEGLRTRGLAVMAREDRTNALVQLIRAQQEERNEAARAHGEAMERLMRE